MYALFAVTFYKDLQEVVHPTQLRQAATKIFQDFDPVNLLSRLVTQSYVSTSL